MNATPSTNTKRAISYRRFSSIAQGTAGRDSVRRQNATIDAAFKKYGLTLDGEFHDWGKSAYHQKHIAPGGALYELRRLAVNGKLKGKVLVLENWDRAGRLQVTVAAPLLMDMLNNGVDLVVGFDAEYFSRENVNANPFLLYRALDEMHRGFGESTRKSEMAKSKWQSRFEAIANGEFKPLGTLPWWLENGKNAYVIKKGMDTLIKRIFELYLSGKGSQIIAKQLNAEKVAIPPNKDGSMRKNANGWNPSYIQLLIQNRALIGYYHKTENKIFPAIVSETDFYKANAKRKERIHFAGRKAEHINPFMGLCYCTKCGNRMITHHSGAKSYGNKRYSYLMCGESRKGNCSAAGLPIDVFEESFSVIWENKDMVKAFMQDATKENSKVSELHGKLNMTEARLEQIQNDYLQAPSTPLAKMLADLENQKLIIKKEIEHETITERGTVSIKDAFKDFGHIHAHEDWDTPETRLKVQECYRNMIDRITIDIQSKSYDVQFKNGKELMKVTKLTQEGCTINGVEYRLLKGILKHEHGMSERQISKALKDLSAEK